MFLRPDHVDDLRGVKTSATPVLTAAVITRLCGFFFLSRLLILSTAGLAGLAMQKGQFLQPGESWLERFAAWDANWYLSIATTGYQYSSTGESSVAFYPLYPMLIRAVSWLGVDSLLAGYAISHLALLGCCFFLWKIAAFETRSGEIAERAVIFLLFCPGAVWFGMVYTESLFLLTLLGCIYSARRGSWLAAGAWGFASALTRTPGLLLAGFLFLEAGQQWLERRRESTSARNEADGIKQKPMRAAELARAALGMAGPVLGHGAFLLFLQLTFGDWRAQQKTMLAGWNSNGLRMPSTALLEQWRDNEPFFTFISDPMLAVVVVLSLVSYFTLRRWSYPALVLALTALSVAGTTGESLPRYLSTSAPVFLVMAQLAARSRLLEIAFLVFSVALAVLLTALLANGYRIM